MKQYLDLLQDIIDNGVEKESGRENMPNTKGLSFGNIKMDLSEGFPLLTTKKMFWKGIVHELLWFLRGDTNIKYLVDNKVNIWNGDAYRWYQKWWDEAGQHQPGLRKLETMDEFIEQVKQESNCEHFWKENITPEFIRVAHTTYTVGDLGKVYGYQWRDQHGVDQIKDIVEGLKSNPYSRYHILDGWNKADFSEMALPPCHLLYQFIVRPLTVKERLEIAVGEKGHRSFRDGELNEARIEELGVPKFYLDLNMYQRSCDTLLGVPFNIASMSLLLMIISKVSNMIPGISNWIGGDTHLYVDHIDQVKEQISREPMKLPKLKINKEIHTLDDILELTIDDFELMGYESHDKIRAELFTGLKK